MHHQDKVLIAWNFLSYIVWNWISTQKTIWTHIKSYVYLSISHCLCLVLHRHMSHSGNILNIYVCLYIYMCVFHVQYFHICLCIPFLLWWNRNSRNYCKVPIAYANATDLSGRISSILFSVSNLHHLWIIFYLLIWDLFFIKDLERNDINHTNGQKDAIILMILQTIYV